MSVTTSTGKEKGLKSFFMNRERKDYVNPYLAGALLGLVMFTSLFSLRTS